MAATLGHMDPFDVQNDDWSLYTERLGQFFVANDIAEDKKKVAVLLTVVGTRAYELLHSLLAPTLPSEKSYGELVKALQEHLNPKPLVIAERFRFHHRNQKEDETVAQYMAALRKHSERCDFGDYLEQALRDRLVCGLRSEIVQRRLLSEKDLTLQKAYDLAHSLETASRRASELQASAKATTQVSKEVQRVAPGRPTSAGVNPPQCCYRCGKTGHHPDKCYYRFQKCRGCGKRGHIVKMCRSVEKGAFHGTARPSAPLHGKRPPSGGRSRHRTGYVGSSQECSTESNPYESATEASPKSIGDSGLFAVRNGSPESAIIVEPKVNGVALPMELDTGASVSLISERVWKEILPGSELVKCATLLKTYTGERLHVLGQLQVGVNYSGQEKYLPLLVVAGNGPSLWGRNWLNEIRLDWGCIKRIQTGLQSLLTKYAELFREELGTLRGVKVKLVVPENATAKFFKPRPVPYAIRGAIEKDLERLENLGVIEKTNYSDWAAPIVAVPKPNGTIHICGDYKVTINPVLQVDQYPVPKAEDLFANLAGGQKFTKLDLSHAYQQVLFEEDSRQFVTINTHKGLYQYNRLPFGIASAPAIFQQTMEKILQGLPGVTVYIDDILVTGRNDESHLEALEKVMERLYEYGLRLKKEKCLFMQPSVEYLGYIVDKDGLHATPAKVEAITKAPEPRNVHELRSVLGLVNYYGKFIRHLSTLIQPLNHLLCRNVPWKWSKDCQKAFDALKEQLASSEVLVHYDPDLPLKLDCDASAYGVGAVLSHVFPNGVERPIAYASRTLTQVERGYAQLEKEALSLIYGVKKFHQFLYGRRFTLVTDHKPLLTILGPKKGLPTLAAARLQRWAIILTAYQYDLEFRSTNAHSNADGFSRLPLQGQANVVYGSSTRVMDVPPLSPESVFNLSQIEFLPVDTERLRRATQADPVLSKVRLYTQKGWPNDVDPELKPYANRRYELTVEAGCLLWGMRVVIPDSCRKDVLRELHTSHPGIVKMKSLARIHVWWPEIDKTIEQLVRECETCQSVRNNPSSTLLHPWSWPDAPWKRIHVDFAGPFQGSMFMVIVDAHSKWLEVVPMSTTTTEKTLDVLRSMFARYGLPEQLVSDNGPQFISSEFERFMKENGIKHIRTSPYHPSSNGEAERFVQTFKHSLKASKNDPGSLKTKLSRFLITYRNTPSSTTGVSPAELFMRRPLCTRLDLLRPSVQKRVQEKQADQKRYHDAHSKFREFDIGQSVLVRNLRDGAKWIPGTVIERTGPVSYRVQVLDQVWRRHTDQLLEHNVSSQSESVPEKEISLPDVSLPQISQSEPSSESVSIPTNEQSNVSESVEKPTAELPRLPIEPKRYPRRERKCPDRLSHKL